MSGQHEGTGPEPPWGKCGSAAKPNPAKAGGVAANTNTPTPALGVQEIKLTAYQLRSRAFRHLDVTHRMI
jgi:hypothetical protein